MGEQAVNVVYDLIFSPGSSLKLVPVINISVLFLLCLMAALTYSKIATIHIIVMSTLSVCLLLSVNWFYYEFKKAKAAQDGIQDASATEGKIPRLETEAKSSIKKTD